MAFKNSISENEGRKPDKNSSLRILEFMHRTSTKNACSRIPSQDQQNVLAGLLQLKVLNFKSISVATEPLVSLVASDEMSSSGSNPFPLS
jgi:hypothetical protein